MSLETQWDVPANVDTLLQTSTGCHWKHSGTSTETSGRCWRHLLDVTGNTMGRPRRRQHIVADIDADIPTRMRWPYIENGSERFCVYACILYAMWTVVHLCPCMYVVCGCATVGMYLIEC